MLMGPDMLETFILYCRVYNSVGNVACGRIQVWPIGTRCLETTLEKAATISSLMVGRFASLRTRKFTSQEVVAP